MKKRVGLVGLYEEAVAMGWVTVEPTTGPTAKPGLPKAGN